ncbi:MAG: hypothetical protein HFG78_07025 [Hungatella sp.]|nr:hypothetical protein [Hungatella sp.]
MKLQHLLGKNYHYIWSDGWHLEDNKAWFMAGSMNLLFYLDRNTNETSLISKIPLDRMCAFRQYPKCVKLKDKLICLPDNGIDIWIYHLFDNSWSKICLDNPKGVRITCSKAWVIQEKLYILSLGLKKIIEIDIINEKIECNHDLRIDENIQITDSVLVDNCIYIIGFYPVKIYKFNTSDSKIEVFNLSTINDKIHTICYDGEKFWLSGRRKKIYLWDKAEKIIILNKLPDSFGILNFDGRYKHLLNYKENHEDMPLFFSSIFVGNYIWLIPFQTNEILFINKDTYEINILKMEEENQSEESLKTQLLNHKYLFEYIREDRYIGLFSLKNKWVIEIDAQTQNYTILDYKLGVECKNQIYNCILLDYFKDANIVSESVNFMLKDLMDYLKLQEKENQDKDNNILCGSDLYMKLQEN